MKSVHDLYLVTITLPCVYPCVSLPPNHVEGSIGKIRGYSHPCAQPNPPRICQTPLPVYHYISYFPCDNLQRRRRNFMNSKINVRQIVMGGMLIFPKCLRIKILVRNHVTTFSLCLLAHACHVVFQLVKTFSSLDITVLFLVYMDKLVCINIDSDQGAIRQKYLQR